MNFIKNRFLFSLAFVVSALLALGTVYWYGTQNDLKTIQILSDRNIAFLQSSCSRYEHFVLGKDTKDLLNLREKALILKNYCKREHGNFDKTRIEYFTKEQGIDGILISDANLNPLITIGSLTDSIWNDKVSSDLKSKILKHPNKTSLEHVFYENRDYDIAVISRFDNKGLIFCLVDRSKNALLSSRITVQDMLGALWLEKGAVAFISDDNGRILFTNSAENLSKLREKDNEKLEGTNFYLNHSQDDLWYGRIAYYKNYKLGVFFPENMIFSHRNYMIKCYFLFIVLFIFVVVFIKYVGTAISISQLKQTSKALRCIGEFYETVIFLRLDKNELDVVKAPKDLMVKMKKKPVNLALQSFVDFYASEDQNSALSLMLDKNELISYLESEKHLEISVVQESGKYRHNIEIVTHKKTESEMIESVYIFVKESPGAILLKNKN